MENISSSKNGSCLDTIKTLHQTIVSLRTALEQSKTEILYLKQRVWPTESIQDCLSALTIENHVLKSHLLNKQRSCCSSKEVSKKSTKNASTETTFNKATETKSPINSKKSVDRKHPKKAKDQNLYKCKDIADEINKQEVTHPEELSNIKELKDIKEIGKEDFIETTESNLENKNQVELTETVPEIKVSSETSIEVSEQSKEAALEKSEKPDILDLDNIPEEEKISVITDNISPRKISTSLESLSTLKSLPRSKTKKNLSVSKTISFSNIADLTKTVKLFNNSEFSVIETDDLENITMTENTQNKLINSSTNTKIVAESLVKNTTSSVSKSVNHPAEPSQPLITVSSSPTNMDFKESENNRVQSAQSQSGHFSQTKPELKELVEEEPLNVFEDSASSPSTVKEKSPKSTSDKFKRHGSPENISAQNDLEQNDEVDDIELIFTTDETKESDFKGELVPIDSNESMHHLQCPVNDTDQNLSFEISDRELEDDVFNETGDSSKCFECTSQMYNSKSDNSINQEEKSLKSCYSCQDSSFENKSFDKEESFDQFEEKVRIIETDISKCGIVDVDLTLRRNTCPNPLPYRPIIHRETLGKGLNIRKGRPILGYSSASRRDSGAQTDISALPSTFWRSESSLAHKVKAGENFATLPSKLPLPCSRIKLSEKTVEARRVLLSDIGFTSMVPELSRSADHLGPESAPNPTPVHYGQFLRTPDLYSPGPMSQKFNWASTVSPIEMSRSQSRYSSIYPLSPPAPSRRCSAPVSPSRRPCLKQTSKVRFANGSLPELRVDWNSTGDSGDSTDSLVEEAESFLRRSIDCLTGKGDYHRVKGSRRASAPEPSRDSIPLDWQPFLPRTPHDLRHEHWVKVIVPGDGKVRGGRVRYIGPVTGQTEQYVGVQLSTPDGHSDGVFHNRRYFSCEPHHAVFVPFKKVIMGWKP